MKQFTHGNTYYSHANPPEELRRNFRVMKKMGINTVRVAEIWPGWSVLEPDERRYEWELLDDYVEKALSEGLRMVMGIGINDTPSWLYIKYPGLRFRDSLGHRSSRRVQSACFDNQAFRDHMARFIREITQRYADVPGITAWQFGNEIRYGVKFCDCESTRLRFRVWLKDRYAAGLDELNAEWGTQFRDWEEIYPYESQEGPPTSGCTPHMLRSYEFQNWSVEELVSWGTAIVREGTELPVFHNCMNYSGAAGSQWKLTEPCDLAVIDIYAVTYERSGVYNGYLLDTMASIARQQQKPLWIGETSAGQYGTYTRIPVDQRLVENCVIEQIGAGAEGLFYFRHKAPVWEQPHKFTGSQSLLRTDESETQYVKTPRHITAFLNRHGDRILNAVPVQPPIAVYHPMETITLGREAGFSQAAFDSSFGNRGLWSACGLPVELFDTRALLEADLSRYKIVSLPMSYLLPRSVGTKLQDFTESGGTLVSEGRPGYVDENGLLFQFQPGAGLHEVFGCREDLFYNIKSFRCRREKTCATSDPLPLRLPYLKQTYRLTGGKPFLTAEDGSVCGTVNRFGTGRAYLIGGLPSHYFSVGAGKYAGGGEVLNDPEQAEAWAGLYAGIAQEAGVNRPVSFDGGHSGVSARYLTGGGEHIVFLINYSEHREAEIRFKKSVTVLDLDGETSCDTGVFRLLPLSWKAIVVSG